MWQYATTNLHRIQEDYQVGRNLKQMIHDLFKYKFNIPKKPQLEVF
jgi:hypothetical protein